MTAGHVIPADPNGRLRLLTRRLQPMNGGMLAFRRWNKRRIDSIDVRYLEIDLDPPKALAELDAECVTLNQNQDRGPGIPNRPVAVLGIPYEKVPNPRTTGIVGAPISGLATLTIPTEEWDKLQLPRDASKPDSVVDVFLDFPQGAFRVGLVKGEMAPQSPVGMSGGRVWDYTGSPSEMWCADRCMLFAIQSAWNRRDHLRAVQVIHWLRLLYADYPGLRPEFERAIPRLGPEGT